MARKQKERIQAGADAVALYHIVYKHEEFEESAQALFKLIQRAQSLSPGKKRILYLDIEGHRNSDDDLEVDKNALSALYLKCSSTQQLNVVTGKILYRHNKKLIWFAGGKLSWVYGIGKHIGFKKPDQPKYNVPQTISYASGCLMFFHRNLIEKIGLLYEPLFMYLDDTHFSMRLYTNSVPIYYEPSAIIYHDVGPGESLLQYPAYYLYFSTRNRIWVTSNTFYRYYLTLYTTSISIFKILVFALHPQKKDRWGCTKAILNGLKDAILLNPYTHSNMTLDRYLKLNHANLKK